MPWFDENKKSPKNKSGTHLFEPTENYYLPAGSVCFFRCVPKNFSIER